MKSKKNPREILVYFSPRDMDLYRRLVEKARREHRKLSELCRLLLERWFESSGG